MRVFSTLAITAVGLFGISSAQNTPDWQATPFNPPAIPLAVRSPYLSAWLQGGNTGGRLNGQWPTFWTGSVHIIPALIF
jgi:hypothetical protein